MATLVEGETDKVRCTDLVCLKARLHGKQEIIVLPSRTSWSEAWAEMEKRLGQFAFVTLQSVESAEGHRSVGFEPITGDHAWQAAIADHTGGKWYFHKDSDSFIPTVLLECRQTANMAKGDAGALSLEFLQNNANAIPECFDGWLAQTDNVDKVDDKGRSALILAVICDEAVSAVLSRGANPDLIGDDGFGALHHAVMQGDDGNVQLLLEAKANPNLQVGKTSKTKLVTTSIAGQTALHLACDRKRAAIAKLLLDANCDVKLIDSEGSAANLAAIGLPTQT